MDPPLSSTTGGGPLARLIAAGRRPVPADSTAVFRIGYGLIVTAVAIGTLVGGRVDTRYLDPEYHLTYPGFGWVAPLPGPLMSALVIVLALFGLSVALGYRHRLVGTLLVLALAYTQLIDVALYTDGYWFLTVTGLLLVMLPVDHRWSLDAHLGRVVDRPMVAAGVVWALRAQVAVVFAFSGLAKLNHDWLGAAQPLRDRLADRADLSLIGPALDETSVAYLASWGGAMFDCTIVLWLLWRRTRPVAYLALVVVHLAAGIVFGIGPFPLMLVFFAGVFFEPGWPSLVSGLRPVERLPGPVRPVLPSGLVPLLAALIVVEIALPLRHFALPGYVRWTDEGYYWSWRTMIAEKVGTVDYEITDPATGNTWIVGPEEVLTEWQAQPAATRPSLILATAHLLADHYETQGTPDVEVRARTSTSLNGRSAQQLVDPGLDLAALSRLDPPRGWILDLEDP